MNCPSCAAALPDDAAFCGRCGSALRSERACARCGRSNASEMRFCLGCGSPLAPVQHPDPRAYTPKHLADKILASKSALEGERKQVTVLFADVKSSKELAESVDPEEWHQILDRFFQILADGVHRYEGTINQYTGDGIMALFGAPIAHEDHAQRACFAALHLQGELRRYAEEIKRTRALSFAARLGLNSGDVVVGKIGDDLRMDYTAQGSVVGVAQRMEQLAEPGRVYVAEPTAKLVGGYFALRDLGPFELKGMREPIRVHELEGAGTLRTRFDVSLARGLSKFVGRGDEMLVLESALARATEGNGQVVGVVAEAGVGKSRLCFEFAERCRARGIPVHEAHGVAHGKSIPLLPVLELWRNYFGITEQDGERAARDKIAGRVVLLDAALTDALPLLFDLLGVPDPERPAPRIEAEARQRQLAEITRRLAQARSRREPAVFLMEDLHWIDEASEWFVESLVESLPRARTLLLVNFRPEYDAAWMKRSWYRQLPLLPLGPEATDALLAALLGTDPSLAGLGALLRERTGGNPFFVEEVVQSLLEHGALVREGERVRLTRSVAEIEIPATVQAVLAARIDRLPEREKQLLQTASVLGRTFSEPLLAQISDLVEAERREALRALVDAEFLYEESLYPVTEYAFKHPLTQEVAYRTQLGATRARVHAAVARALEEMDPDKLDERAALLAHHWEGAGEAREAARWHRRAAEWAGGNHMAEAMRHWRRVRDLLDTLPPSPETLAEGAVARAQLILDARRVTGFSEDVEALARDGRRLAEESGDLRALAIVLFSTGYYDVVGGSLLAGVALLEEARKRADEIRDLGLQLATRCFLSFPLAYLGRLEEALRLSVEAVALGEGDPLAGSDLLGYSPLLLLLAQRGWYLPAAGRLSEAARGLDRALEVSRESGQWVAARTAHGSHVLVCQFTGDAQAALAHGRASLELAEKAAHNPGRVGSRMFLGLANLIVGQPREAVESLAQALALTRETRSMLFHEPYILALLARARLGVGDVAAARATAAEALDAAKRRGTRLFEIDAWLALARIEIHGAGADALAEARSALDRAESLVRQIGASGHLPFLHEERAALARLQGNEEAAVRELREAQRLFAEVGATGHATRLARELAP